MTLVNDYTGAVLSSALQCMGAPSDLVASERKWGLCDTKHWRAKGLMLKKIKNPGETGAVWLCDPNMLDLQ